jgi:hypothetical protein
MKFEKIKEGEYLATSKPCPSCNQTTQVEVSSKNLFDYNQGALIQNAFPHLTPEVRERFQSGYCPTCWKSLFA